MAHHTYLSWIEDAALGALLHRAGIAPGPGGPAWPGRRPADQPEPPQPLPPRTTPVMTGAPIPEALRSRRPRPMGLPLSGVVERPGEAAPGEGASQRAATRVVSEAELAAAAQAQAEEPMLSWAELGRELNSAHDDAVAMQAAGESTVTQLAEDEALSEEGSAGDDGGVGEGLDGQLHALVESLCAEPGMVGAFIADADGLAMAMCGVEDLHLAASAVLGTALDTVERLLRLGEPNQLSVELGDGSTLTVMWARANGRRHALGVIRRSDDGGAVARQGHARFVELLGEERE